MKNKTAIIFDMDGTIIDTERIWKTANHTVLANRSVPITPELVRELENLMRGMSIYRSCSFLKERFKLADEVHDLVAEKTALANSLYETHLEFIPGFQEFHSQLRARNYEVAIATNAVQSTVDSTNRMLDLTKFFGEHIYTIEHVDRKGKPDPDIYLLAAEKIGKKPHECIAIEDSPHGVVAAQRAGMVCVGINTAGDRAQLHQADLIVDTYKELHSLLFNE